MCKFVAISSNGYSWWIHCIIEFRIDWIWVDVQVCCIFSKWIQLVDTLYPPTRYIVSQNSVQQWKGGCSGFSYRGPENEATGASVLVSNTGDIPARTSGHNGRLTHPRFWSRTHVRGNLVWCHCTWMPSINFLKSTLYKYPSLLVVISIVYFHFVYIIIPRQNSAQYYSFCHQSCWVFLPVCKHTCSGPCLGHHCSALLCLKQSLAKKWGLKMTAPSSGSG